MGNSIITTLWLAIHDPMSKARNSAAFRNTRLNPGRRQGNEGQDTITRMLARVVDCKRPGRHVFMVSCHFVLRACLEVVRRLVAMCIEPFISSLLQNTFSICS